MSWINKGDKLYSIIYMKCPQCHEGDLYPVRNPYNFKYLFAMNTRCDKCGLKYELEPSFFYGAMYVNYALSVAISVAVFLIMFLSGIEWPLWAYVVGVMISLFGLSPVTFRIGKSIYLNFFIHYNPKAIEEKGKHRIPHI
ncbi:MAG: DUF983 domain-containing protein [Salibacteraceae bacterium]